MSCWNVINMKFLRYLNYDFHTNSCKSSMYLTLSLYLDFDRQVQAQQTHVANNFPNGTAQFRQ